MKCSVFFLKQARFVFVLCIFRSNFMLLLLLLPVLSVVVLQDGVLNVVMGCNDDLLSDEHVICTAASCTTNCLAPVVKVRAYRKKQEFDRSRPRRTPSNAVLEHETAQPFVRLTSTTCFRSRSSFTSKGVG